MNLKDQYLRSVLPEVGDRVRAARASEEALRASRRSREAMAVGDANKAAAAEVERQQAQMRYASSLNSIKAAQSTRRRGGMAGANVLEALEAAGLEGAAASALNMDDLSAFDIPMPKSKPDEHRYGKKSRRNRKSKEGLPAVSANTANLTNTSVASAFDSTTERRSVRSMRGSREDNPPQQPAAALLSTSQTTANRISDDSALVRESVKARIARNVRRSWSGQRNSRGSFGFVSKLRDSFSLSVITATTINASSEAHIVLDTAATAMAEVELKARRNQAARKIQRMYLNFKQWKTMETWRILVRLKHAEDRREELARAEWEQRKHQRMLRRRREEYKKSEKLAIAHAGYDPKAKKQSRKMSERDRAILVALFMKHGFPDKDDEWDVVFDKFPSKDPQSVKKVMARMNKSKELQNLDLLMLLDQEELQKFLLDYSTAFAA